MSGRLFARGEISWLLGIEDTCVYPADPSMTPLDEHVLTEHDRNWRDDLATVARLGATGVRYGVSWPLVHLAPGRFDWRALDEVVAAATDEFGLELIADLVHYGTPSWLGASFADPGYPAAIEEFASAFAERYAGRIRYLTPVNEPVTTASFCGLRGVWPPALTGWRGWVSVVVPLALGMVRTMHAVRAVAPGTSIVHVEASTDISTTSPEQEGEAELLRNVGWLPTDLILGRVDASHPMRAWLREHGASDGDLEWLVAHPARPDVFGVNYYPDLTPRRLIEVGDRLEQVSYDGGAAGLARALEAFGHRYGGPLAVTETSIEGSDEVRRAWLADSSRTVQALARTGLDVRGYTWWPLLDFIDWSWAAGGANVEEFVIARSTPTGEVEIGPLPPLGDPRDGKSAFLRRMGLVRLEERSDGSLERRPTAAAQDFARLAKEPDGEEAST